jgi:antitoxin component YwqK of YwqJK toxin-antitoxin module
MKSKVILTLLLLISAVNYSQVPISKKIYLDSLWNETDEINHKYYRIVKDYSLKLDQYIFKDYYKSGKLQMIGGSRDKDRLIKEGSFIFYYENGNKKVIANYANSIPKGKQFDWYENGQLKSEIEYLENQNGSFSEISVNQFWNTENVQKVTVGNGDYEYSDEGQHESGKIKNGFHDGIWKGYNKNLNCSYTENYENGKFISGVSIDSNNTKHEYTEISAKPKPKKGMQDFNNYIARAFIAPKVEGLKGTIYLTFVIETDGSINDTRVLRDIGYGTGEEAIRTIKGYKGWIPGEQRGIKVRCTHSIPITIQTTR